MSYENRLCLLAAIIAVFIWSYSSSESQNFKFDLQNVNNEQRDKLFNYLDLNKDSALNQKEFDLLLKSLFASTKLKFNLMDLNNITRIDKEEFNQIWEKWIVVILKPKSALIVVDMQNDFIADNGSMRVKSGTHIIPVINKLITSINFDTIVYTYDWHPSNHCSFIENIKLRKILPLNKGSPNDIMQLKVGNYVNFEAYPQIEQKLWPKHCVQNTEGAKLYKDVIKANNSIDVRKGMDPDIDSYSAFFDNGELHKSELSDKLLERGITDVYLSGVVYEYCVGFTAMDALKLGFRTAFIEDAIISLNSENRTNMRNRLIASNASIINSSDALDMVNGKDRKPEMGLVLAQKLFDIIKRFNNSNQ